MRRPRYKPVGEVPFSDYVINHNPGAGIEIVPWCLYDTQILRPVTTQLEFFTGYNSGLGNEQGMKGDPWTNMYLPGMLPNPQAFLMKSIVIYGLSSALALGSFTFQIGAKWYQHSPAWLMAVRPKWNLNPPLLIAPQIHFRASLTWEAGREDLGKGLDGLPKYETHIQVGLLGQLARPIQ